MSCVPVEVTGVFTRTDLSCPVSESMRQLIAEESERWRESSANKRNGGNTSLLGRILQSVAFRLRRR